MNDCFVNITGRIITDAATRSENNTTRVVFTLSATTDHKSEGSKYYDTDLYNVSWYGKQAETCLPLLVKGATVVVNGHMSLRAYKNKEGLPAASGQVKALNVKIVAGPKTAAEPKPAPAKEEDPFDM